MNYFVTAMTAEHVRAVEEIEKLSFSSPRSIDDIMKTLAPEYSSSVKTYVAASDDSAVVGYAVLMLAGDESELPYIAVDERYRRCGIGKMLLSHVISEAMKHNAGAMFLEVRESNTPARSLYDRFGFERTGIRKNYYRYPTENAVNMKKLLQHP